MGTEDLVDRAGDIREGEGLDLDKLKQHLEPILGSKVGSLSVKQFPGGHSNLTYLLSSGDDQWVLRRPPFGSTVKSAHDMSREFKILSALEKFSPTVLPQFISAKITIFLAATFI